MHTSTGEHYWTLGGVAVGQASWPLVNAIIETLSCDEVKGELDRERLTVGPFAFDLYRGQVFSGYIEQLHDDTDSGPLVRKYVPVLNLSWLQRRKVRKAAAARASKVIAQHLRAMLSEDRV